MARRVHPDQMGFAFPEPTLPWLAAPPKQVALEAPCAIALPIPEPDRHGVIDLRPVLWSLRTRAPYTDGYDGYVALRRDLGAWHRHEFDFPYNLPEEVHVAVDGDVNLLAYPVRTGRGHWLCGGRLSCGGHDWTEMPDVTADVGGTTREAALRGFARYRAAWFESRTDQRCHSGLSDATRSSAARVTDLLRAYADAA